MLSELLSPLSRNTRMESTDSQGKVEILGNTTQLEHNNRQRERYNKASMIKC